MKLVVFQPGDGTRYLTGIEDIDPETAFEMGWSRTSQLKLFIFHTATKVSTGHGLMFISPACFYSFGGFKEIGNYKNGTDDYTASAAMQVFEFLTSTAPYSTGSDGYVDVQQWWDKDWRDQLCELKPN